MKRVCHISTVHRRDDVRILVRECGSLVCAGYEVHLVIGGDQNEDIGGLHVHTLKKPSHRLLRILFAPWRALSLALQTKADLYHYHDPELIGVGFLLRWLFQKPVVFDIHECIPRQLLSKHYLPRWAGRLLGVFYRACEAVLTVGQAKVVANANSVEDYRRCTLVQNYPVLDKELVSKQREFDLTVPLTLVYVGVVAVIRGAWVYLDLVARLKQRGHAVRLIFIGEDNTTFGPQLHTRITELGLTEDVEVTGRMEWHAAMQVVSNATIGLCLLSPIPNYTTCLATKIIEYMMVGTPVLASDFDCWRPYVEGEGVGRLADPSDIDAVVAECETLLGDPEALTEMSRRAQTVVREKYNWQQEFSKLQSLYEKLLGE